MRRKPTLQNFKSFLETNAEALAEALIERGIYDTDPVTKDIIEIKCWECLRGIRRCMIEFFRCGCQRQTFLLSLLEYVRLPSGQHFSERFRRCYLTLYLDDHGYVCAKFTWTDGLIPAEHEKLLVDKNFQKGMRFWAHSTTEGAPLSKIEAPK